MAFSKIIFNGTTLMDVTQDTVAADNLLAGETATGADGEQVTGAYVPSGGGGGEPTIEKGVIFVDYTGEIADEWDVAEVASKTTLPNNPSHTGLTAQGWNWTLPEIKTYLANYPKALLTVGQMYVPTSGATEIDVTLDNNTLHPYVGIAPNGTVSIDWGDGSATSTITGASLTTANFADHTYTSAGDYTIKLTITSGKFALIATNATTGGILSDGAAFTTSREYRGCIKSLRLGGNVEIGNYGMTCLYNCQSYTIPSGITTVGTAAFQNSYNSPAVILPSTVETVGANLFQNCYNVKFVSMPAGMRTMTTGYTFQNCYGLRCAAIPSGVSNIGTYMFANCYVATSITIPNAVTSIGQYTLNTCVLLKNLTLPSNLTSIGNYALTTNTSLKELTIPDGTTSIGQYALQGCYGLEYLTLPSSLTSIAAYAFRYGYSLQKMRFNSTTPPTVASNTAFTNLYSGCVISVPVGSLSAYTSASNYPSSSSYTYIEEA